MKNIDIDSISKVNSDKGKNEKVSHEYTKDKKDKMTSQKGENDKMVSKDNKNNKSVVLPDADLLRINSDKSRIGSHEDRTKEKDKMTDHKGGKVSKDNKNNKGIVLSSGTDSKEISQAEKTDSSLCNIVNNCVKPLKPLNEIPFKRKKDVKLDSEAELDLKILNEKVSNYVDPPLKKDSEEIQGHPVVRKSGQSYLSTLTTSTTKNISSDISSDVKNISSDHINISSDVIEKDSITTSTIENNSSDVIQKVSLSAKNIEPRSLSRITKNGPDKIGKEEGNREKRPELLEIFERIKEKRKQHDLIQNKMKEKGKIDTPEKPESRKENTELEKENEERKSKPEKVSFLKAMFERKESQNTHPRKVTPIKRRKRKEVKDISDKNQRKIDTYLVGKSKLSGEKSTPAKRKLDDFLVDFGSLTTPEKKKRGESP